MIRLRIVGDGDRDNASLAPLIESLLGSKVNYKFHSWSSLRLSPGRKVRSGYARKLIFAMHSAVDAGDEGVVAVVDTDRAGPRVRVNELKEARADYCTTMPPLPTAVGEAVPHGEAWLVDDRVAVRKVLALDDNAIKAVIDSNNEPKATLNALIGRSERNQEAPTELLREIAEQVQQSRCPRSKQTGFAGFAEEVRDQLGPLTQP